MNNLWLWLVLWVCLNGLRLSLKQSWGYDHKYFQNPKLLKLHWICFLKSKLPTRSLFPTMIHLAMWQIIEDVTQPIGYSQVSPVVMVVGGEKLYMWHENLNIVNLDFDLFLWSPIVLYCCFDLLWPILMSWEESTWLQVFFTPTLVLLHGYLSLVQLFHSLSEVGYFLCLYKYCFVLLKLTFMLFVLHAPWYRARVLSDNFCLSFALLHMWVVTRAIYEGRSEINASYFIMLAHDVRGNVIDMAVEVEPSHQYSVKFHCRATWQQRGSLTKWRLTWKCI